MIQLTREPIDSNQVFREIEDRHAGGHAHFVGTIRQEAGIEGIEYECYESMALLLMEKIVEEAGKQWPIIKVAVVHRYGWVPVGEAAVAIAISCGHRAEAFEACRYVIDRIKSEVPIWKKDYESDCHCHRSDEKMKPVTAVVLAGGQSSRFGRNKAFASYQGSTFVERTVRTLQSVFENVILVTNTQDYHFLNIPILQDFKAHQGPIGGIVTALSQVKTEQLFVVACDMPLLDPQIIREVVQVSSTYDAVIPVYEESQEYLMAVYSRKLLAPLCEALLQGRASLKSFFEKRENILWYPIEGNSSFNVNTPVDFQLLEKMDYAH